MLRVKEERTIPIPGMSYSLEGNKRLLTALSAGGGHNLRLLA